MVQDILLSPQDSFSSRLAGTSVSRHNTESSQLSPEIAQTSNFGPKEYADKLQKHSETSINDSLYSGQSYRSLAELLGKAHCPKNADGPFRPYERSPAAESNETKDDRFAWLYELRSEQHISAASIPQKRLRKRSLQASDCNRLLILKGYPSYSLLGELGSCYNIDAEFFHRHLSFLVPGSLKQDQTPFFLPSAQRTIFQLSLTTIGVRSSPIATDFANQCAKAATDMNNYLHSLRIGHDWNCGHSVVRVFTVFGEELFGIEQKVSIYVARADQNSERWIVILWFDCGDDLCQSPKGPWCTVAKSGLHTYFRPTVMFKPNISLKEHKIAPSAESHGDSEVTKQPTSMPQSIRLLSSCYGRSLHRTTMSEDPFYVLNELFAFVAASEVEVLKIVSSQLDGIDIDLLDPEPTAIIQAQGKLLHYRRILEAQSHKISEVLTFMQNRSQLKWPQSNSSKALNAAERTKNDFAYLLDKNSLMQQRCERELTTITNSANIAESRSGIAQSKRVFKLTLLATGFVPLSFSTSLFGMNFVQFQHASRGFWSWAVVSIPVLCISLLILLWDGAKIKACFRSVYKAWS